MANKLTIEKILDSAYDGISAIDKDGRVVLFNKAAKNIFKLPQRDYVGEKIEEITPNPKMPEILKTQEGDINMIVDISEDLTVVTSRMPILDEDNQVIGAVAVFKEVPQLQYLSTEVSRLEEIKCMMNAIFYAAQDAISVANRDGTMVMVNRAYEKLLGCSEEEILGKTCEENIIYGNSLHRAVLNNSCEQRGWHLKLGKNRTEVIADGAPIMVDGKLAGSVVVAKDITEIKTLAGELESTQKVLRELSGKYTFADIIGEDPRFIQVVQSAKKAAKTSATILLQGESGTGKEIFAHAIHNESLRARKPFLSVNCAAINEALLESELFGYEAGAFTGASKHGKAGYFEHADGGTLFLDEVSKMSLALQSKLLRVLQEKELLRVGSNQTVNIDVRIIAATNIDLEEEISKGTFREDLFYRLNMVPIRIPPLRERKGDIAVLAMHMIQIFNVEYGRQVAAIDSGAMEILENLYWKGNIRELKNFIGRAIIYMEKDEAVILQKHLPDYLRQEQPTEPVNPLPPAEKTEPRQALGTAVCRFEKQYLQAALAANNGNRKQAAEELGISLRSLFYKMKEYDIR